MINTEYLNLDSGKLDYCNITGSKDLDEVVDLGDQPLCDSLIEETNLNQKEQMFPLRLMKNQELGYSQLDYVVPHDLVYHPGYPYRPGITKEIIDHHTSQSRININKHKIQKNSVIVDIGSNDGTLLQQYKNNDMNVIGVEPTDTANIANNNGILTYQKPFDKKIALEILLKHGAASIITATNVFAHMATLDDVIRGIQILLDDEGVFIFENHYMVDIIKHNQYDTIYHEHIRNYSLKSLIYLFNLYNMSVIDAEIVERYNGSIKVTVSKKKNSIVMPSVNKVLMYERDFGLYEEDVWNNFKKNIFKSKKNLTDLLNSLKVSGKTIVGNSCPGRCSTLINYCKIDTSIIPYIAEQPQSLKIGKYLPGMRIPIVNNEILFRDMPDYIILFAWHLAGPIIKDLKSRGIKSKFIMPLPHVEII